MDLLRDADIDPAPLAGKRVAIIGFGNQGRAQALNLQDSGIDVVVGLRGGSSSATEAEAPGLTVALVEERSRRPTSSCCSRPTKSSASSTARSSRTFARAPRSASATGWRSASG